MNSRSASAVPPQQAAQGPKKTRPLAKAGMCTLSIIMASGPMLEGRSGAENPPQAPVAAQKAANAPQARPAGTQPSIRARRVNPIVSGDPKLTRLQISDGKESAWVYAINKKKGEVPSITLEGPARLTVRYYPVVGLKQFPTIDSAIPRTVNYTVTSEGGKAESRTYKGQAGMSNFRTPAIDHRIAVIGTLVEFTVMVPAGKHTVSILSPGFMADPTAEDATKKPAISPVPPMTMVFKPAVPQKPAAPANEGVRGIPRFSFEGERESLHAIGSAENSGDMNRALAMANIRLRDELALGVGASFSSFGMGVENEMVRTSLRSYSADAAIGLAFARGRHRAMATGFGGYRAMLRDISLKTEQYSGSETAHGYELGGRAEYGYGHIIEATVSGSNNPFCPLSAKIRGEMPFGWVKGARIWVEADALWLHAMKSISEAGTIGGITLDENNIYARLMAGVPIWRVRQFVPSVLVVGTLNASEAGFHRADLLLGAALSFEAKGLWVQAGGGASPLSGAPFFLLGVSYK